MTDPRAELQQWVRQDADAYMREYVAGERRKREANAEAKRQQQIAKNKPAWDQWRAERELRELMQQVIASEKGPTDEHRATYERLHTASRGSQK